MVFYISCIRSCNSPLVLDRSIIIVKYTLRSYFLLGCDGRSYSAGQSMIPNCMFLCCINFPNWSYSLIATYSTYCFKCDVRGKVNYVESGTKHFCLPNIVNMNDTKCLQSQTSILKAMRSCRWLG